MLRSNLLLVMAASLTTAGCSYSAGGGAMRVGPPPAGMVGHSVVFGGEARAKSADRRREVIPGHLYVSSVFSQAVFRFPLVHGFPAQKPDAIITGFTSPGGIAVDQAGELYVVDVSLHKIDVYAPGASGPATPIRVLSTRRFEPEEIALTNNGYMFLTLDNAFIGVYSMGAEGHDPPLAILWTDGSLYALASDATNTVYVSNLHSGILAYPNIAPPPKVGSPAEFFPPARDITNTPQYPISWYALTVHGGEIYARNKPDIGPYIINAVFPANANGPVKPVREIVGTGCHGEYDGLEYGLAVSNGLFYQACQSPNAIFVYDARANGRTKPLAAVYGPFSDAEYLALGP